MILVRSSRYFFLNEFDNYNNWIITVLGFDMTNEFIWLDIPVGRTLVGIMHSTSMVGLNVCESSFYFICYYYDGNERISPWDLTKQKLFQKIKIVSAVQTIVAHAIFPRDQCIWRGSWLLGALSTTRDPNASQLSSEVIRSCDLFITSNGNTSIERWGPGLS